jgi:hypothetical protein
MMLFGCFAEGMPARRDDAQLGYDAVRGLSFARDLGHAELTLHAKPLHGGFFVLSGEALTLFTTSDQVHPASLLKRHPVKKHTRRHRINTIHGIQEISFILIQSVVQAKAKPDK